MKKIDDIAKIKQSFEEQSFAAPLSGWSSIEKELRANAFNAKIKNSFEESAFLAPAFDFSTLNNNANGLDNLVASSFEQTSVSAPSNSWDKIQDGLDTNEVWERMSGNIKVGSNKWTSVLVAASVAVLFTLIPSVLSDQELDQVDFGGLGNLSTVAVVESSMPKLIVNNELSASEEYLEEEVIVNPSNFTNEGQEIVVNSGSVIVEEPVEIPNNISIDMLAASAISEINVDTYHPELDIEPLQEKIKPSLSVGIIGGANTTWILDNETRAAFERETLSDSKIAVGEMYGFSADLWLNEKNGFSTNILLNSVSRNRLGYYDNGVYKIKNSQISFFKISALYARKFKVFGKEKDHSFVVKAGPYLGINRRSFIKEGETLTSFNSAYKKVNYGLNVQFGQEFEWSNFIFGYGLNSEVGLRNMFKGDGALPSDLNYTSNFDAGVYVSLKYKLN